MPSVLPCVNWKEPDISCAIRDAIKVGGLQIPSMLFKPKSKGNDSLDDYDYGEEDSEEWETEDEESDEPDADGGSAEEDDEDSVK